MIFLPQKQEQLTYMQLKEHTRLCFLISFVLIHMDAHLQLIYSITLIKVFIQNIKFRKMIVFVQRIVCICYISQIYSALKMQF